MTQPKAEVVDDDSADGADSEEAGLHPFPSESIRVYLWRFFLAAYHVGAVGKGHWMGRLDRNRGMGTLLLVMAVAGCSGRNGERGVCCGPVAQESRPSGEGASSGCIYIPGEEDDAGARLTIGLHRGDGLPAEAIVVFLRCAEVPPDVRRIEGGWVRGLEHRGGLVGTIHISGFTARGATVAVPAYALDLKGFDDVSIDVAWKEGEQTHPVGGGAAIVTEFTRMDARETGAGDDAS